MTVVEMIIEQCEHRTTDWCDGESGNRTLDAKLWTTRTIDKQEFIQELIELSEEKHLLNIRWYEHHNQPERIQFQLENLPVFYQLAGRKSKQEKVTDYETLLENLYVQTESGWIKEFYTELSRKVKKGNLTEIEKCPSQLWDCLSAIDKLREPVYKRAFSKRVLNNSKLFENEVQNKIVSIAKKYHPDLQDMDDIVGNDTDEKKENRCASEVLSQLMIEDYSQELSIKGALKIILNEVEIDLGQYTCGTILNSETLKFAKVAPKQTIQKIILVENKANYIAMPYEKNTLIIFCHGFFTPKEREFLLQLQHVLTTENVEYYHTGDLDYGGIRIFQYNRDRIFPDLQPFMMDAETYYRYNEYGEPITKTAFEKVKKMKDVQLQPLIDAIIKEQVVIEQEIFMT